MADSEAERIRNKRLAKLAGNSTPASQPSPADTPLTKSPSTPAEKPIPQKRPPSPQAAPPPKINISSSKPPPSKPPAKEEPIEIWEDRTLRSIFAVSLTKDVASASIDSKSNTKHHLKGLEADLLEDDKPLLLNVGHLDQVLAEAGTLASQSGNDPFIYLLRCFKRASRAIKSLRTGSEERLAVAKEARRLCVSYCLFASDMPEMFETSPRASNILATQLLAEPESEDGIDPDFLADISARFDEDDSYVQMLVASVEQLSNQLAALTMEDDYKPYMRAMRNLVQSPKIISVLTQSDSFLSKGSITKALDIEHKSLLGPFFRLSPLDPKVALNYFTSPRTMDKGYIVNAQKSLRLTLQTHQGELFEIANSIIRASKESREALLDWFAMTVNENHKRRAIRPDGKIVSTDGFMLNITAVLDQLCDPFIDASFSKIDRVDINYFRRSPRVDIKDETKINADQKDADDFYAQTASGENNFISELFFLTVAAHHYGSEAVNHTLTTVKKEIKYMEQDVAKFEAERVKYVGQPAMLMVFDRRLEGLKKQLDTTHALIHAAQGALLDELLQARSMQFMRFVIVWLLRIASGKSLPKEKLTLPLPDTVADAFKFLPQYFVEDIVDSFKFITRNMPYIITSTQCEELVQICITFLRSSQYIKSPYLKSGLVSILFHGVWPFGNNARGVLGDVLNGLEFCHHHLLHALMQFYIECESTGSHTQFFDKFNIRYEIDGVIKCIWPNAIYRDNLGKEASTNTDFFVRFVNLLLNDVTFVLDESFSSFEQIRELTRELSTAAGSMEENIRKEKEELLADHKGRAKSYMGLTNETISMLKLFTEALSAAFTMPEVVQRLADMLGHNIDALAGPNQAKLNVENREEYDFNPKQLLSDLLDVYLNLGSRDAFLKAVARDGRSYKPANFQRATGVMERFALKSRDQLNQWADMQRTIAEVYALDQQAEEDLGDIPDELLDPIMGSIMEDPVLLPSSKQIVDRSTIRSHLLSDPTDPFNRVPLRIEDVVDAVDKKKEIADFVASKRAQRTAGDPMDTSA